MVQASWRRAIVVAFGMSVMALSGCAATRANTEVKDSWLARVPEEQLGDVRQAQANRREADDEVTRAKVAVDDAERALQVARRNADAAKLRKEAEEARLEAAHSTGQQAPISRAQEQLRAAEAELAAAQAQVSWREESLDAQKAQRKVRESELQLAEAELSLARYLALREHGDVRVQELRETDFRSAIAKARSEALAARSEADSKEQRALQARAQWERLRDQAQGYGGAGRNRP
ncbi:MAG: hypothetical protein JXB05_38170 [Myxococcaceae bacterium]|nr:hypothetical protein [Myxococcaceae bacterium]